MIQIFKKIKNIEKPQFSMPLSLQLIKESSSCGIDYKNLHIIDLYSIIYSIRIDNAKQYLEQERNKKLMNRGISSIQQATEEDFNNL